MELVARVSVRFKYWNLYSCKRHSYHLIFRTITKDGAPFFLSAISECEIRNNLRHGEHLRADRLLTSRRILPVDSRIARRAAEVQREQRVNGRSIKTPDALILATALELQLAFVTRDKQLRFARTEYGLEFLEP